MLPRCTLPNLNRYAAIQHRLRTRTEGFELGDKSSSYCAVLRVEQPDFPSIPGIVEILVRLNHSPLIVGQFVGVGCASEQATSSGKRENTYVAHDRALPIFGRWMKHGLYLRQQIQFALSVGRFGHKDRDR